MQIHLFQIYFRSQAFYFYVGNFYHSKKLLFIINIRNYIYDIKYLFILLLYLFDCILEILQLLKIGSYFNLSLIYFSQ